MKKISTFIIVLMSTTLMHGQSVFDALRYSRFQSQGSARFIGMGSSMGALGGESSSITINPAALGVYRNSEFTISSAFNFTSSNGQLLNNSISQGSLNFNIPNISYIQTYNGDVDGWKKYGFALGHNRTSTFQSDYRLNGQSMNTASIIDDYVSILNSDQASISAVEDYAYNLGPSQAYYQFLINPDGNFANRYVRIGDIDNTSSIERTKVVERTGSQSETYFSFGGNYQDKLHLGGSIGLQSFSFEERTQYAEFFNYTPVAQPSDSLLDSYYETSELITSGTGVNLKLGFIYRINEALRLGGALHSPTFFGLRENFAFDTETQYSDGEFFDSEQQNFEFEYRLRTPLRLIGSLGYVLQQKAAFNLEYEYVNYGNARFDDKPSFNSDFSIDNQFIQEILTNTHNIRFGTEIRLDPFVARAGFRYEDNPFVNGLSIGHDESRKTYTLGGGLRNNNFNLDIAYSLSQMTIRDGLFNNSRETGNINQTIHQLVFTVGWRW